MAVLLVPVLIACHCCPLLAQNEGVGLEKSPHHSCCADKSEIINDCTSIDKTEVKYTHQDTPVATTPIQANMFSKVKAEEQLSIVQFSPPPNLLSAPIVLRI